MPSGKTHDAITVLLAIPAFAIAYISTGSFVAACEMFFAFLFGGFMFGPDLDTISKQYSRWSIFRFLWFPYRAFFKHRSRYSHGLFFGALLRVIYFLGVVTLSLFATSYIWATYSGGELPSMTEFIGVWSRIGEFLRNHLGQNVFLCVFLGLWLGAASHTFTDIAVSFIKTGRVAKFL